MPINCDNINEEIKKTNAELTQTKDKQRQNYLSYRLGELQHIKDLCEFKRDAIQLLKEDDNVFKEFEQTANKEERSILNELEQELLKNEEKVLIKIIAAEEDINELSREILKEDENQTTKKTYPKTEIEKLKEQKKEALEELYDIKCYKNQVCEFINGLQNICMEAKCYMLIARLKKSGYSLTYPHMKQMTISDTGISELRCDKIRIFYCNGAEFNLSNNTYVLLGGFKKGRGNNNRYIKVNDKRVRELKKDTSKINDCCEDLQEQVITELIKKNLI